MEETTSKPEEVSPDKDSPKNKLSKEEKENFRNKEDIMREHLSLIPDSSETKENKFMDGYTLHVDSRDDDDFHIKEHEKFLSDETITTRGRHRLESHIRKHKVQKKLKSKMFGSHNSFRKLDRSVFESY